MLRRPVEMGFMLLCAAAPCAGAAEGEGEPILVTAPGSGMDEGDALVLGARDIAKSGAPDLLQSLIRNNAGVTLQEVQGNPWQPNIVYRGFIASPLQGQAQGIAVYLDGGRFNLPFGDTVQLDLLPEAAISRIAILNASPVYGLNALGGAMVVETKTGRSDPGLSLRASAGRFGYAEGSVEAGWSKANASAFIALQQSHDSGWRDFSPSTLYNGFADLGWDGATGGVHLKLLAADSSLTGNGVAPVELLAADRRAVFTHPDSTRNRYGRASLHPWLALSITARLEAAFYLQYLRQRTWNGDAADIEACEDEGQAGFLCLESIDEGEAALLVGTDGVPIATSDNEAAYGVLNRSRSRSVSGGALVQLVDERPLLAGMNRLALGFSHDRSHTRFAASTELGVMTADRGVDGLGPIIAQPDGAIAPVGLLTRAHYWGLFLSDDVTLAPGLSARLGLRWNRAGIRLDDRIGSALDGSHRFQRLNPGVKLDFAASKGLQVRLGYAESNRVPTPAELSCASADAPCSLTNFFVADPPLKQVVSKNWDIGLSGSASKGGWHLDWSLSAYRSSNSNDIQYIASSVRGRGYFQNMGETRRQGMELMFAARKDGLETRLSYAFADATFRSPFDLSSPAHPGADEHGIISVAKGDRIPGVPRHSAVLTVDYTGRGWSAGGDILWRSGQYLAGDEANLDRKLPGYAIVNLRGSVQLTSGIWLHGELRNAFNRRHATFGTYAQLDEVFLAEAPDASNPRAYGPGAPRRWQIGFSGAF